jgi:hypothetical protein
MKLVIGRPDDSEIVLAEEAGGTWRASANLAIELGKFLQDCNPEELEMWVEDDE